VEASSATSEITVVTNDKKLASAVRGFKARTLSIQAFVAEIERKHKNRERRRSETKSLRPIVESPKQLERLKKLFEERLLEDD
jgi:predicted RNA-binding protein with PIN domain